MKEEKTLLEKAKECKKTNKKEKSNEEIQLALAWANQEVSLSLVQKVMSLTTATNAYVFLALALKDYLNKKNKDI